MKALIKYILAAFTDLVVYLQFHPVYLMRKNLAEQIAEFIKTQMPEAIGFHHTDAILDFAVQKATAPGTYLEFGVYKGRSIRRIARLLPPSQIVHGFDSFAGLPEDWSGTSLQKGEFNVNQKIPHVPRNVRLYPGWFEESLPKWLQENSDPISFIHVDCDLYSSAQTVLEQLEKRIQPGTILLFDEYYNYPNWKNHEYRAFQEFIKKTGKKFKYLAYPGCRLLC